MESKNVVTNSQEWLKNFKAKMNEGISKYRGKVTHISSQFKFHVNNEEYVVFCPASKIGNNVFRVYKDLVKIYQYEPRGGHVNKTSAEYALRLAIAHKQ